MTTNTARALFRMIQLMHDGAFSRRRTRKRERLTHVTPFPPMRSWGRKENEGDTLTRPLRYSTVDLRNQKRVQGTRHKLKSVSRSSALVHPWQQKAEANHPKSPSHCRAFGLPVKTLRRHACFRATGHFSSRVSPSPSLPLFSCSPLSHSTNAPERNPNLKHTRHERQNGQRRADIKAATNAEREMGPP